MWHIAPSIAFNLLSLALSIFNSLATVIINKRGGNPCPKCLPFVGKVLIDDVWSGGSSEDGPYPLMSSAMAAGLYHPRCKDIHTTYFLGISAPPDDTYTIEELNDIEEQSKEEAKEQYLQRQLEGNERLSKYSLDPDNKKKYQTRADECKDTIDYMSNSFRPEYAEHSMIEIDKQLINVKKVKNSEFDMLADIDNTRRSKAVRLAEKHLREIRKIVLADFEFPTIAVVDFDKNGLNSAAIGGYHSKSGILFINSKFDTNKKILEYVNKTKGQFANSTANAPYLHELGHKYYYDCIKKVANRNNISYNESRKRIDTLLLNYINSNKLEFEKISSYAYGFYQRGYFSEIIAECMESDLNIAKILLEMIKM